MNPEVFDGFAVGLAAGCLLTTVIYQLALWLDEKAKEKTEAKRRGPQDTRGMDSRL